MAVKMLMTWDIIPGREQEYFEFVVRDFIPGVQRLGLEPGKGAGPNLILVFSSGLR